MKKANQIRIRIDDEDRTVFINACDSMGLNFLAVLRDLCKAVVPYINTQCTDGRWHPPVLISERQAAIYDEKSKIIQVHNGNGHQIVKEKKS